MDMDNFLKSQRCKLEDDKDRVANNPFDNCLQDLNLIPKSRKLLKNCNEIVDQEKQCNKNAIMDFQSQQVVDPFATGGGDLRQSQQTETKMCEESSMATCSSMHRQRNVQDIDAKNSVFQIHDNLSRKYRQPSNESSVAKTAKDLANLTERQGADVISRNGKPHRHKDDMEQWVSDTFYSYFPGFNNENKKRQDILLNRQLEYRQNFLKHQMTEAAADNEKKTRLQSLSQENTDDTQDLNQKPLTSRSDKTDLEIIVNNPDYDGKSPRPGSARHKLLQDLRHTEISNIVNSDGVTERNRRNAEMEMAKKKDYQKELMAQIEEKRRAIEVLKEKERRQEEALTRKLQEQLKTMRLEEELEKEKMRADKVRFDSEQNRLMREHLLTKLEHDAKLLCSSRKTRSENDKAVPLENKVYKYFSNSARHEYKRGAETEQPPLHLDLPESFSRRKECFHDSENHCPACGSSLKSYESWCLNCESRILDPIDHIGHLVCDSCKKQYSVCSNCDKTDTDCVHCKMKRNICVNCRGKMCSNCIDAIVSRDSKQKPDSEASFQILEVNYPEESDEDVPPNNLSNNKERTSAPYSLNINRNSIFHPNFSRGKVFDDESNIETIRRETDRRLSRYLKNYGDLASKALRDRSTQTTPDSASRRDIVMMEENNLSMPLLREMPRMTRKESNMQQAEKKKKGTRIENLARRWEVPAVQKHIITTNSPKVLTQLGAIRKQLQSEKLQLEY